jgi:hypothetical protein
LIDIKEIQEKDIDSERDKGRSICYGLQLTHNKGYLWFNGESYTDLMNTEAVDAFIESTHAKYEKEFSHEFGLSIPGLFTDEPSSGYANFRKKEALPWTNDLPERFKETYKYDILSHIPSLFFNTGEYMKVRYDYWRLVTKLFSERYMKKIYEWCDARGLKFTGHLMGEDTLTTQTFWGVDVMQAYEYMHQPGIDNLTRTLRDPLSARQCSIA